MDFSRLGERSIYIDCDVLVADGGTRTASITGGYVALALAVAKLRAAGLVTDDPLRWQVSAVSAGIVAGAPVPVEPRSVAAKRRTSEPSGAVASAAGAITRVTNFSMAISPGADRRQTFLARSQKNS